MKRKAIVGVLMLSAVLVFSGISGWLYAAPVTQHVSLTGYVSCTTCVMPNACKAQTRLACTQWGISQGASYVLVVGNDHYTLVGFEEELAKAAAVSSVTISGDLTGRELVVSSVDFNRVAK